MIGEEFLQEILRVVSFEVFSPFLPPPPVKDLMVMPWLQRVGEAHYYVLK